MLLLLNRPPMQLQQLRMVSNSPLPACNGVQLAVLVLLPPLLVVLVLHHISHRTDRRLHQGPVTVALQPHRASYSHHHELH